MSSRALLLGEERALASPWSQGEHERQVQRATWLAGEKAPGGSSHRVLGWLVQQHTRGKSPGYRLTAGIDTMCAMTIVLAGYHEGTCPLVWPETVGEGFTAEGMFEVGPEGYPGRLLGKAEKPSCVQSLAIFKALLQSAQLTCHHSPAVKGRRAGERAMSFLPKNTTV